MIPNPYIEIISHAKELGYVPTQREAAEISGMSAGQYGRMREDGTAPKNGNVSELHFRACTAWAIHAVMDHVARFGETVTGSPGELLTSDVAAALVRATGKSLRIRIEEV